MKIFCKRISRDTELEKKKIVFQFALMLVASVVCGILFCGILSDEMRFANVENIRGHFIPRSAIGTGLSASTVAVSVLRMCAIDLFCIIVTLVFAFSAVNYLVSDLIIAFLGFRFGLSATLVRYAAFAVGAFNALVFWIVNGVACIVFLYYSCKVGMCSLRLRRFSTIDGKTVFNVKTVVAMLSLTFFTIASLLLMRCVYFILVYLI